MSDSICITEALLIETLRNVVEPAFEDVKALLARGDSESGVIHEYRYEAIKLLTTLATTLLEWYEDCEGPFIVGEVLVGWKREAAQVGGDEPKKVPFSSLETFTSIAFTVTIAKVMLMYGMASYDAQETLAGYKAVEQACAVLERVQETGTGINLRTLTEMCSLSRRQYITAGAPTLIFGSNTSDDGNIATTAKKVRKSLAGGTLLLDCYVYMCMAWGRWNNVDHVSLCLHAATELATDLVHRRDKFSREHKKNKIDQIIASDSQHSEKVEQMRSVQEDSQRRAIEERIKAKKAKAAAAKAGVAAGASSTEASSSSPPTTDPSSSSTPTTTKDGSSSSSQQYLYCFTTTDASSGCAMKLLSWNWSDLASEHTTSLSTCSPIPEIRQLAKAASESSRDAAAAAAGGGDGSAGGATGSVLIQSSELLGWLHMGLLETEEAVRIGEARLLTASAHANKAANSITATMYCHKSLSHQISRNLLKSPQDVEDWVFAALNLAEFYLNKVDLSHLEHCLLAVDSLIARANLYVPGDRQKQQGDGTTTATTSSTPNTRDITSVWSSFDLLQYRYLWASLHHHLLLLSQNALSFVATHHHPSDQLPTSNTTNPNTSESDSVPKYPTSDAVISVLQRGVIWVKCRLFHNPLLLPEGARNLPSDERDQFILENVTVPGVLGAGSTSSSSSLVPVASGGASSGSGSSSVGSWGMEERIPFGVSGVPPPRTHMLIALPQAAITHHKSHNKAKNKATTATAPADDAITTLSHHLNPVLSTAPVPYLTSIAFFNGCGWPTISSTDVSRIAATRPEVADQVVAKFLVGALRHTHRMQDQLLHHSTAATELASVEADFEKFLLFRRMESDGWLVKYLTSQLPTLASLTSCPTSTSASADTDAGCFPGHYILGRDPSFPGEFSIRHLKIETLPNQRDTAFLEKRLACIRQIYATELNPKAYRNVVRQADYDCGWSCLEIAIETTEAIKMHTALTSGEVETDSNTKKLASLKVLKSKFLDRSLTHFKEFVTGFYTEISVATKAGKQASDALEPSDFPTLFVGEMRIIEVLLKQARIPDAINRLNNHALQFLRQNPSVLREYPELNANKQQCEELVGLLQQEVLKSKNNRIGGDGTSTTGTAVEDVLVAAGGGRGGDVHLSTRPYIPSSRTTVAGMAGKKVASTSTSQKKQ